MLRAIAVGWREEKVAESARAVSELGRELYERLATMVDHFAKLGKRLDGAVQAYNQTVGSLERRVLVSARRFPEHGIATGKQIAELAPIDKSTQQPQTIELPTRAGRRRGLAALVAKQRADALDGVELLPLARERANVAAVRERLVHGEVEAVVARLHRASPSSGHAPFCVGARPQDGHCVRLRSTPSWKSSSSTRPSDAASSVCSQPDAARPLRPASSRQRSSAVVSSARRACSRNGRASASSSGRGRVRLARRRPDDRLARLGREHGRRTSRAPRRRRRRRPARRETAANAAVELLGDRAQVLARELVDVALEARLRPAALVVPSGLLLGQVGERLEPPAREPEEEAALAVDHARRCAPSPRPTSGTSGAR